MPRIPWLWMASHGLCALGKHNWETKELKDPYSNKLLVQEICKRCKTRQAIAIYENGKLVWTKQSGDLGWHHENN